MNTVSDLQDEFSALAAAAPDNDAIRAALADRIERHAHRRRSAALMSVAAAVVLVAGGIGLTRALVAHGPARPAGLSPVVTVPDVPLPADTQLIRHQLKAVTSPVTATPPAGLTGQVWNQTPGRLTVSWFDQGAISAGWSTYTPLSDSSGPSGPRTAGYVVTDSEADPITELGPDASAPGTATNLPVTVGGHAAVLSTAPAHSVDPLGFPASERLTWQLSDGRWIHVWATVSQAADDSQPSPALADFAATIAERSTTLDRTIGIGLTLPGLTHDYSMNSSPMASYMGATMFLCPPGVDPYGAASSTSSGSGSAPAPTPGSEPSGSAYRSSVSISPRAAENYVTSEDHNPAGACLTIAALNGVDATAQLDTTSVHVGKTITQVDVDKQAATADLGNGLTAVVGGPTATGPKLSAADLAALAASVRVSPAVTVIPLPADADGESSASATASSAAAPPVSSGSAAPDIGTIAQPFVIPAGSDRVNTDSRNRVATIDFPLQNITDVPVTMTNLHLGADGLTETAIKVRLANEPDDPNMPFSDVVLPAMVAPRSTVQLQFEFTVGGCSEIAGIDPPLIVGYQIESSSPDGSSGSGSAGDLSLNMPDFGGQGWVAAVTGSLCG